MKITLIADVYGQGNNGTAITAKRFVENLRKRGHQVFIASADEHSDYVLGKRNFYIFNNYIEKQNGVALASIKKEDKEKIRKAIENSDVVHILLPFQCGKYALKVCRELHVPYTTAFHCQPENVTSHIGMKDFKPLNNRLYKYYLKTFYKDVHFIHCPSKFIADEITKQGYKAQKYVISNGVADHIKKLDVEKPDEFKDKIVVLNVGRYSKEKCQNVLIKAIKLSKYKDKIQLILGGNGPQKKKLEKLSKDLPIPPIFKFFNRDELAQVLSYADIFPYPSDIEIEGISCLEAMTCGQVPIVSDSPRSATKDFALTEHNIFKSGDAQELAQKIDYLIEHPKEKMELSKKYLEFSKQFQIDACIEKMEKMLNDSIAFYKEYYDLIK